MPAEINLSLTTIPTLPANADRFVNFCIQFDYSCSLVRDPTFCFKRIPCHVTASTKHSYTVNVKQSYNDSVEQLTTDRAVNWVRHNKKRTDMNDTQRIWGILKNHVVKFMDQIIINVP